MLVVFEIEHKDLVLKKAWISKHIAGPTVSQCDWNKHAEKPSGPGALSGYIENKANHISAGIGLAVREVFVDASINGAMALDTVTCELFQFVKGRYKTKVVVQKTDDETVCVMVLTMRVYMRILEMLKRRALSRYLWFLYSHK